MKNSAKRLIVKFFRRQKNSSNEIEKEFSVIAQLVILLFNFSLFAFLRNNLEKYPPNYVYYFASYIIV